MIRLASRRRRLPLPAALPWSWGRVAAGTCHTAVRHFHLRHGGGGVCPGQPWRAAGQQLSRTKRRDHRELERVQMWWTNGHLALLSVADERRGSACGVQPRGIAHRWLHSPHSYHANERSVSTASATMRRASQRGHAVVGRTRRVGVVVRLTFIGFLEEPW